MKMYTKPFSEMQIGEYGIVYARAAPEPAVYKENRIGLHDIGGSVWKREVSSILSIRNHATHPLVGLDSCVVIPLQKMNHVQIGTTHTPFLWVDASGFLTQIEGKTAISMIADINRPSSAYCPWQSFQSWGIVKNLDWSYLSLPSQEASLYVVE